MTTKAEQLSNPPAVPPLFYGVASIVNAVGVSETTLKTMRQAGLLGEPCRIGKRVVWTAEQVAELAANIKAGKAADLHVPVSKFVAAKDAAIRANRASAKSTQTQNG